MISPYLFSVHGINQPTHSPILPTFLAEQLPASPRGPEQSYSGSIMLAVHWQPQHQQLVMTSFHSMPCAAFVDHMNMDS